MYAYNSNYSIVNIAKTNAHVTQNEDLVTESQFVHKFVLYLQYNLWSPFRPRLMSNHFLICTPNFTIITWPDLLKNRWSSYVKSLKSHFFGCDPSADFHHEILPQRILVPYSFASHLWSVTSHCMRLCYMLLQSAHWVITLLKSSKFYCIEKSFFLWSRIFFIGLKWCCTQQW